MGPLEKFLFLVVVWGRSPEANIDLHDVKWVTGSKIEDIFYQLRNDWFRYMKIDEKKFYLFKEKAFKKSELKFFTIN